MADSALQQKLEFDWRNSPLFRFFEECDWELFVRIAEVCEKTAGSEIWSEGGSDAFLICILQGSLESIKKTPVWGKPIIMAEFLSGATVGEPLFADPYKHSTTLRVTEDAKLMIYEPDRVERLLEDFPSTAAKLWRGAACLQQLRLRQANARLATLF